MSSNDNYYKQLPICGRNCLKDIEIQIYNYFQSAHASTFNQVYYVDKYGNKKFTNPNQTFHCGKNCISIMISYDQTPSGEPSYMIRIFDKISKLIEFKNGREWFFRKPGKYEMDAYNTWKNKLDNRKFILAVNRFPITDPNTLKETLYKNFFNYTPTI